MGFILNSPCTCYNFCKKNLSKYCLNCSRNPERKLNIIDIKDNFQSYE